MFREKMKTPAIPERVYTLCKIVEKKPLTVQELKNKMEPDYLQQSTSYFADYREAAEELGLISVTDQNVELAASPSAVRSTPKRCVHGASGSYTSALGICMGCSSCPMPMFFCTISWTVRILKSIIRIPLANLSKRFCRAPESSSTLIRRTDSSATAFPTGCARCTMPASFAWSTFSISRTYGACTR